MSECRGMDYESRLNYLELPKLEDRRMRGDMILTYRLLSGEEGIDYRKFFRLSEEHYELRGQHSKKIALTRPTLDIRKYFFSWRVIQKWNSLTEYEVSAPCTSVFKERYDRMEIEGRNEIQEEPYTADV